MFNNLIKALDDINMSTLNYSKVIGCSEKSARNKLNGKTEFVLSEINKTKEIFPQYTLEYLFKKSS